MNPAACVTLTATELLLAAQAGAIRQVRNMQDQRRDKYGAEHQADPWGGHIYGASAECAVAKYLGRYWAGNITRNGEDVHGGVEVRWAAQDHHCLILHPDDHDAAPYVLVTGTDFHFTLRGWMPGADGKQDRFWKDPTGEGRPAFFVPQTELRSAATLKQWLTERGR